MAGSRLIAAMAIRRDEGIVQTTKASCEFYGICRGQSRSGMHNLEVAGASPAPATKTEKALARRELFQCWDCARNEAPARLV